jgi:acetyl esterase
MRLFLATILLTCVSFLRGADSPPARSADEQNESGMLIGAEAFVYRDGSPEPMRLYVFKPNGWATTDQRAALLFFFGGGWTHGTPERSAAWAKYAARLGMVGIAPDYRTRERFDTSPLASVADGRAALRWVQDHATELGIDPQRIAVGGNSSGGHVALWTGLKQTPPGSSAKEAPTHPPAALILYSTVSDTSQLTGYTPQRFGDDATALSPLHQLESNMPPILAFHGDADRTVPFAQAVRLHEKLMTTGNVTELVAVPKGDHGFTVQMPEWKTRSRELVEQFLTRQGVLK